MDPCEFAHLFWFADREVVNHDDSENGASPEITESTFVRSVYFKDPDGILLEFAAWTRELDERDVNLEPAIAVER